MHKIYLDNGFHSWTEKLITKDSIVLRHTK